MGVLCMFPGYTSEPIRTAPRGRALLVAAGSQIEQAWRDWLGRWWRGRPPARRAKGEPRRRHVRLRLPFKPTHWLKPAAARFPL